MVAIDRKTENTKPTAYLLKRHSTSIRMCEIVSGMKAIHILTTHNHPPLQHPPTTMMATDAVSPQRWRSPLQQLNSSTSPTTVVIPDPGWYGLCFGNKARRTTQTAARANERHHNNDAKDPDTWSCLARLQIQPPHEDDPSCTRYLSLPFREEKTEQSLMRVDIGRLLYLPKGARVRVVRACEEEEGDADDAPAKPDPDPAQGPHDPVPELPAKRPRSRHDSAKDDDNNNNNTSSSSRNNQTVMNDVDSSTPAPCRPTRRRDLSPLYWRLVTHRLTGFCEQGRRTNNNDNSSNNNHNDKDTQQQPQPVPALASLAAPRNKTVVCAHCGKAFSLHAHAVSHMNDLHPETLLWNNDNDEEEERKRWTTPLAVCYQDDYMAVVIKPQGMPVMGGKPSLHRSNLLLPHEALSRSVRSLSRRVPLLRMTRCPLVSERSLACPNRIT